MRNVSQGLWVAASLAPSAALVLLPTLKFIHPAWSWPLLGAAIGVVLLVSMVVMLYTMAKLDAWASGRPNDAKLDSYENSAAGYEGPNHDLANRSAPTPTSPTHLPSPLLTPRGFTALTLANEQHFARVAGGQALAPSGTEGLQNDTSALDAAQRGMRAFMPCVSYANDTVRPAGHEPWKLALHTSPDGMSYSNIFVRERFPSSDTVVLTLMDGLGIITGNVEQRRGFGELLGGLFAGASTAFAGWIPSFPYKMLGMEVGMTHAGAGFGARCGGGFNSLNEDTSTVRDEHNCKDGPFVGTSAIDANYALVHKTVSAVGKNVTPTLAKTLPLFGALRAFWRQDKRVITTKEAVNSATSAQVASFDKDKASQPSRDLTDILALLPGERASLEHEHYRGSLKAANITHLYLGQHVMAHGNCSINVKRLGEAEAGKSTPFLLEMTFTTRTQEGERTFVAVPGGLGGDAGKRTFEDDRQILRVAAHENLKVPFAALLAALEHTEDKKRHEAAWAQFTQKLMPSAQGPRTEKLAGAGQPKDMAAAQAPLRREWSRGDAWGTEVGVPGLPPLASYLKMLPGKLVLGLPTGFGEGFIPRKASGACTVTKFYEHSDPLFADDLFADKPKKTQRGLWLQPSVRMDGPRGTSKQHVTAEWERSRADACVLRLRSNWSMSHADAYEINDYILRPLRSCLGLADEEAPGTLASSAARAGATLAASAAGLEPGHASLLSAQGWKHLPVSNWRTSREVTLASTFTYEELAGLAAWGPQEWQKIGDFPLGVDPACGPALSCALRDYAQAKSLGQATTPAEKTADEKQGRSLADAQEMAWQTLGEAIDAFVQDAQLTAPGLLVRALRHNSASALPLGTMPGPSSRDSSGCPSPEHQEPASTQLAQVPEAHWLLSTESNAYNQPQLLLNALRRDLLSLRDPQACKKFAKRIQAHQSETRAARMLAAEDPFLDEQDRLAHRQKLARIWQALEDLKKQAEREPTAIAA